MIDKLKKNVNNNFSLTRLGKNISLQFLLEIGDKPYLIIIGDGRIMSVNEGPFVMRKWSFALRASKDVWDEFWQPYPAPEFQDIFAMNRFGHCLIEGDVDILLSNLRFVKAVLAAPRRKLSEEKEHG